MSKRDPGGHLRQVGDGPEMIAAIDWLMSTGYLVSRPSPIQLKVGPVSFYPLRGTHNLDNQRREAGRGLYGLKATLEKLYRREMPAISQSLGHLRQL